MVVCPWYEEWYWETRRCAIKTAGLILFSALAFPIGYNYTDSLFWLLLFPVLFAVINVITYRIIHPKVDATRREDSADTCSVDCAVIHCGMCNPGTAVLKDATLTLRPITGKIVALDLNDVFVVDESHYFDHSFYPTKTGFTLYFPGGKSVDFAVANTVAKCWRPALQKKRSLQQVDVA